MGARLTDSFAASEHLRASTPVGARKQWGQFFTAPDIATYMASLIEARGLKTVRVLDPGAGTGTLGLSLAAELRRRGVRNVDLVAVEVEKRALAELTSLLSSASRSGLSTTVLDHDVLDLGDPQLGIAPQPFDVVIANPPYFKISPSDPRAGGTPNVYTRFMEVASRLLKPGGELCFIIPRSFASGLYFKEFRRSFHRTMTLVRLHVFESRRDAFKGEGVLQENIIVHYRKAPPEPASMVTISTSQGAGDLSERREVRVRLRDVIDVSNPLALLAVPANAEDLDTLTSVRSWSSTLSDHGMAISTGPVVPFRATEFLCKQPNGHPTVPLLWMQHVKTELVSWPLGNAFRKPEHILALAERRHLLVANRTYVLLRRFSAKEEARRLTAAVLYSGQVPGSVIGLENHLNFIHRPGGELSFDEAAGMAALLNSSIVDRYFRMTNGNTQVNATDIRALPLPSLTALVRLGRGVRAGNLDPCQAVRKMLA